jgi:hypothetical protein
MRIALRIALRAAPLSQRTPRLRQLLLMPVIPAFRAAESLMRRACGALEWPPAAVAARAGAIIAALN